MRYCHILGRMLYRVVAGTLTACVWCLHHALLNLFLLNCRVYKNFDPRAKIIREVAEEVFQIQGRDPLIDVAVELEKRARADDYFVKRNLYPNVDFYSGQSLHSPVP